MLIRKRTLEKGVILKDAADVDFPCAEVGFDDKTALLVLVTPANGANLLRLEDRQPAGAPVMASFGLHVKNRKTLPLINTHDTDLN